MSSATLAERLYWTAHVAFHARAQARYPFRRPASIRRDQARRVRAIVAYACRHVPYYRETLPRLGLTPADFASADDLAKLPIIEREQLQADPERFLSDTVRPEDCLEARTSGSTGRPATVFYDTRAVMDTMLHAERARAVARKYLGRSLGYRETTILFDIGTDVKVTRWARARTLVPRNWPGRRQFLDVRDPLDRHIEQIEQFKPHLIRSFGSYLELLFPRLAASGRPFHRPRLVTYGGDCLSDTARRLISRDLGIPILSGYQAIEANRIAFECEQHRGLHVNIDLHPVRIVGSDGRPLPPETPGEVVVSTLVNRATVLLNYRLGDTAALLPDACPCGRSLPRMSFPLGRLHDFIELPSGELANPITIVAPSLRCDGVWQWQFVQEDSRRFRLLIVADDACDRAALRATLPKHFAAATGEDVTLEIEFVESIPRGPSGKHSMVVSAVPRARRRPPSIAPPVQEP